MQNCTPKEETKAQADAAFARFSDLHGRPAALRCFGGPPVLRGAMRTEAETGARFLAAGRRSPALADLRTAPAPGSPLLVRVPGLRFRPPVVAFVTSIENGFSHFRTRRLGRLFAPRAQALIKGPEILPVGTLHFRRNRVRPGRHQGQQSHRQNRVPGHRAQHDGAGG